jgi:hypothetical protein
MTDLERIKELFAVIGVPYSCVDDAHPEQVMWDPESAKEYADIDKDGYNWEKREEMMSREMADKRQATMLSVTQGHFFFDDQGRFKGVLADEMGYYKPNRKGNGYWPMPPLPEKDPDSIG